MAQLDETNKGILPKLEEMVNVLSEIISNDTPFLLKERTDRDNEIKDLLTQSNISTSEKFRRVFEAYQIENEYGSGFKIMKCFEWAICLSKTLLNPCVPTCQIWHKIDFKCELRGTQSK